MPTRDKCVVLVTGGSGFLGQHVVGLLQTRAPHVTEIRVLDLESNPYVNKLDYAEFKPVKQFLGGINDPHLLRKACQGVHCVMHIASLIDVSFFPNWDKLKHVNIQGTSLLLEICKEVGVERFIYCSSIAVVIGQKEIFNGTETSTPTPQKFLFDGHGFTKQRAEEMVLNANCEALKTLSLRPTTIYGEEDTIFSSALRLTKKFGRWTSVDCKDTIHHCTYVGNMTWSFICADKALIGEVTETIEGRAYFITDNTPLTNLFQLQATYVKACGFETDVAQIPASLMLFAWYILYALMWLISFVVKVNVYMGISPVKMFRKTHTFKSELAKKMLGYAPLYSNDEAQKRCLTFYTQRFHKQ